jgi:DNA anti-recombination protein RmuC
MNDYGAMSFNELTELVGDMKKQLAYLELVVAEQAATIKGYDQNAIVQALLADNAELEEQIVELEDLCEKLYNGLKQAEAQLDSLGVGLRMFAQDAVRAFEEMFEDGD